MHTSLHRTRQELDSMLSALSPQFRKEMEQHVVAFGEPHAETIGERLKVRSLGKEILADARAREHGSEPNLFSRMVSALVVAKLELVQSRPEEILRHEGVEAFIRERFPRLRDPEITLEAMETSFELRRDLGQRFALNEVLAHCEYLNHAKMTSLPNGMQINVAERVDLEGYGTERVMRAEGFARDAVAREKAENWYGAYAVQAFIDCERIGGAIERVIRESRYVQLDKDIPMGVRAKRAPDNPRGEPRTKNIWDLALFEWYARTVRDARDLVLAEANAMVEENSALGIAHRALEHAGFDVGAALNSLAHVGSVAMSAVDNAWERVELLAKSFSYRKEHETGGPGNSLSDFGMVDQDVEDMMVPPTVDVFAEQQRRGPQ